MFSGLSSLVIDDVTDLDGVIVVRARTAAGRCRARDEVAGPARCTGITSGQAGAAAIPEDGTGTQPARRPYDLRHTALSLWLASGAPPAEIAARAGHSVRVLLTVYAHGIPGCDQIASQHIDRALRPSRWPPAGPQEPAQTPGILSAIRPGHSWTQRDSIGPDTSAQIRLYVLDLRKCQAREVGSRIAAPGRAVPSTRSP